MNRQLNPAGTSPRTSRAVLSLAPALARPEILPRRRTPMRANRPPRSRASRYGKASNRSRACGLDLSAPPISIRGNDFRIRRQARGKFRPSKEPGRQRPSGRRQSGPFCPQNQESQFYPGCVVEPISPANSLLTGKNTGKISVSSPFAEDGREFAIESQTLTPDFPINQSREFEQPLQGVTCSEQGNSWR